MRRGEDKLVDAGFYLRRREGGKSRSLLSFSSLLIHLFFFLPKSGGFQATRYGDYFLQRLISEIFRFLFFFVIEKSNKRPFFRVLVR